jgi:hypothetical protein
MRKRNFQAMGREELASPVAEAIRKCSSLSFDKTCENCVHFWPKRGLAKNWCMENDISTEPYDCCDSWKGL